MVKTEEPEEPGFSPQGVRSRGLWNKKPGAAGILLFPKKNEFIIIHLDDVWCLK